MPKQREKQPDNDFEIVKQMDALFEKAAQRVIVRDDEAEAEAPRRASAVKPFKTAEEKADQAETANMLRAVLDILTLSSNANKIYKETQGHPVVFHVEDNKDPVAVGNASHSEYLPATQNFRRGVDLAKPNSTETFFVYPVKNPLPVPSTRVTYTTTIAETGTLGEKETLTKIAEQREKVFGESTNLPSNT